MLGHAPTSVEVLKENDRTVVLRVVDRGESVVVKVYLGGEGRVREAAALAGTDLLVGTCAEPAAVVLRDLGASFDLSDVLLTFDAASAAAGVVDWGRAVGAQHRRGDLASFEQGLREQAVLVGRAVPPTSTVPRMLGVAAEALTAQAPLLGVEFTAADELLGVEDLLEGGEQARALSPADTCPDNNIVTADGLVLLDFEGATWRHVAWDAAYLTVPWPSCWCSWLLPPEVADAGLSALREASVPYAGTEGFLGDLAVTTAAWAVVTCGWFLEAALDGGEWADTALAPSRRATVQHRLALVDDPRLPQLSAYARDLLAATRRLWGDVPLEPAPAFRPPC